MNLTKKHFLPLVAFSLILFTVFLAGLFKYSGRGGVKFKPSDRDGSQAVPYRILEDYMDTKILIGVGSNIDKGQLEATLIKTADDHQSDAARDLLLSDYLWVEAYLMDGETLSKDPAGKIRRYLPPKQRAEEHADWPDWLPFVTGKEDRLWITLDAAASSL